MKIRVEVEMDPIEARRLLGLPDVEPIQEAMVKGVMDQVKSARGMLDPEAILKAWGPMGAQGLDQLQKLLWSAAKTAIDPGKKTEKPAPRKRTRKKSSAAADSDET